MGEQNDDDPFADITPIWAWAAKLRAAGMSTPVAQYLVCHLVLSDVAVSLQIIEPGQSPAWDAVDGRVDDRDNQDAFEQTNRALNHAVEVLRERMLDHLEAEARQIIRGKAGAP